MAYTTKILYDTDSTFANPNEVSESGTPASVEISSLTTNTNYYVKGKLFVDSEEVNTSATETFKTIKAGTITITYESFAKQTDGTYNITFLYTSTYAISSATITCNGTTVQGNIDGESLKVYANVGALDDGTTYTPTCNVIDIYAENGTGSGSFTTAARIGKYVAVSSGSEYGGYSTDGITWIQTTLPTSSNWSNVCYGCGKYVAVAQNSTIAAYSIDGITWIQTTLPTYANWTAVCYGNGKFVAITYKNAFDIVGAYSTDGITWIQATVGTIGGYSVCFGNGLGLYSYITYKSTGGGYSTDGIHWLSTSSIPNSDWMSVCYGNGKFIGVSSGTVAVYSTNGNTWTQTTLPTYGNWRSVCYGNGKYVAVAYNSSIAAYSEDGITWTQTTLPTSGNWRSVCYGNGKYVAVAYNSNISAYSTDGITWTQTTLPASVYWCSVCYGDDKIGNITLKYDSYSLQNDGTYIIYFNYTAKYEISETSIVFKNVAEDTSIDTTALKIFANVGKLSQYSNSKGTCTVTDIYGDTLTISYNVYVS